MAFIDDARTAESDHELHQRLAVAMASAAINIQSEGAVANHAARSRFALTVLADALGSAKKYAIPIIAGGSVSHDSTDQDLSNRLASVWNAFCVEGSDPP